MKVWHKDTLFPFFLIIKFYYIHLFVGYIYSLDML